jgi:hypothetical protein
MSEFRCESHQTDSIITSDSGPPLSEPPSAKPSGIPHPPGGFVRCWSNSGQSLILAGTVILSVSAQPARCLVLHCLCNFLEAVEFHFLVRKDDPLPKPIDVDYYPELKFPL